MKVSKLGKSREVETFNVTTGMNRGRKDLIKKKPHQEGETKDARRKPCFILGDIPEVMGRDSDKGSVGQEFQ